MTPQQLEVAVLNAIELVRSGQSPEDDRMELKRDWPDPSKARQLAGAANRANGDVLIYIIGIDEKSGLLHPHSGVDPANWWPQLSARFDQVPPDLVRHLNVQVDETGSVTALLFDTSRAPYVVKSDGGNAPEREIPMREGTRTRSARRDEVLRLLIPEITVPPATVLSASISGDWVDKRVDPTGVPVAPARTSIYGQARVFLEYTGAAGILLPVHLMTAQLKSDSVDHEMNVSLLGPSKNAPPQAAFGVSTRHDGIAATGPGVFVCHFQLTLPGDRRTEFVPDRQWSLRIEFGVAGSSRTIRLDTPNLSIAQAQHGIRNERQESLPRRVFGTGLQ